MAQGFVKSLNLFESQDGASAAGILNNLGGPGISTDIALFANNLETRSVVPFDDMQITKPAYGKGEVYEGLPGQVASAFTDWYLPDIPELNGIVPFSNDSLIYVIPNEGGRNWYRVGGTNGLDKFKLYPYNTVTKVTSSTAAGWDQFENLIDKNFYRNDPVTFQNLTSFSYDRPLLNDGSGSRSAGSGVGTADSGNEESTGFRNTTFLKSGSIDQYTDNIQQAVDLYYYKESRSIVSYKDVNLNRLFEMNGSVDIANDAEIAFSPSTRDTMPGLFIVAHGDSKRAFSDTFNPWTQTQPAEITFPGGGVHPADSTNTIDAIRLVPNDVSGNPIAESAAMFTVILNGPAPTLATSNTSHITSSTPTLIKDTWTHKMKVKVNGETFFILLKQS